MSEVATVNAVAAVNPRIEEIEGGLLQLNQLDIPLIHRFSEGVYVREVVMPKGALIIGHEHLTRHFNYVMSGRALVSMDGRVEEIVAPCIFESQPGVRKVLLILEECRWATSHVTDETNLDRLEEKLIVKSETFKHHQLMQDAEKLLKLADAAPSGECKPSTLK